MSRASHRVGYGMQRRSFGLQASETASTHEKMEMKYKYQQHWHRNSEHSHGMWPLRHQESHAFPRHLRGRGMEYKKFMGEERLTTPLYFNGPLEPVHDVNRKKVFYNKWDFHPDVRKAPHVDAHYQTMSQDGYMVNHFSRSALKVIARHAPRLVERRRIPNPHFPSQPLEGPADMPASEVEVYRKQAFMVGIEYPEFPDVRPVEQIDPWDEEGESSVPKIDNDALLDANMWDEINKNVVGMEKKIRAFKDTERKKIWTWKMALLMQQIKRARQEEAFMAKQKMRQNIKQEQQDVAKPWVRKARAEEAKKANEDVSEETDIIEATEEELKENAYQRRQAGTHRPPGTKL
eukprot:TRINITY_DN2267_c0_g1_i9.p1 TRINITY_DN2267_c0_g1~~TRINITY_DN2267_c0_g1_i9.p1  ORF type:complete len:348 (+),score=102.75 TRINITY_DN2267_c0_g1_i9:498-1541(+)